jgi:hypothetical protein
MELAIPIIAIGSMYAISQIDGDKSNTNTQHKEGFDNMSINIREIIPKTDTSKFVDNYPALNQNEFLNSERRMPTTIDSTNAYLNQTEYGNRSNAGVTVGSTIPQTYDFPATSIKDGNHTTPVHMNGKVRERLYNAHSSNAVLDTFTGKGSMHIQKTERAPLFKPESDISWANGMPDSADFIKSRINPSMKNNMVKPFETIKVGTGTDSNGAQNGLGGFNTGMNEREKWMPKTVNELRGCANPKEEYSLLNHEGPATAVMKNRGIQGKVQKNSPDTYYDNTSDRWLATTGAHTATSSKSTHVVKEGMRNDYSSPNMGVAGSSDIRAGVAPTTFTDPTRIAVDMSSRAPVSYANNQGPTTNTRHESHNAQSTNRSVNNGNRTKPDTMFGAMFSTSIGSVVAPIMDVLKPCKKEEHAYNARVFGNLKSNSISSGYTEANNTPKITTKETTLYSTNGFIENQNGIGAYTISNMTADPTQRDTDGGENKYIGGAGGGGSNIRGEMIYEPVYGIDIDDKKEVTTQSRLPNGNTQIFTPNQNVLITKDDKQDNKGVYPTPISSTYGYGPTAQTHGSMRDPTMYDQDQSFQNNRINPALMSALKSNPYVVGNN